MSASSLASFLVFIHNKDELRSSRIHEETTIHSIKVNVTGLSASLGSRPAGAELERVSGELFASQRCVFAWRKQGPFNKRPTVPTSMFEQAKSLCQFVPKSCQHVINHQHHK